MNNIEKLEIGTDNINELNDMFDSLKKNKKITLLKIYVVIVDNLDKLCEFLDCNKSLKNLYIGTRMNVV